MEESSFLFTHISIWVDGLYRYYLTQCVLIAYMCVLYMVLSAFLDSFDMFIHNRQLGLHASSFVCSPMITSSLTETKIPEGKAHDNLGLFISKTGK